MTEAEKVSELHLEVKASLMNEDFEKIKNWQKDAFHKQMMGGFKETKEAEDGFRKAQKPWAKKLKEVHLPWGPALPAGPSPTTCHCLGTGGLLSASLPFLQNFYPPIFLSWEQGETHTHSLELKTEALPPRPSL